VGEDPRRDAAAGRGQYGALWGDDYRQTINDNMLIVIMIETPLGVANLRRSGRSRLSTDWPSTDF